MVLSHLLRNRVQRVDDTLLLRSKHRSGGRVKLSDSIFLKKFTRRFRMEDRDQEEEASEV